KSPHHAAMVETASGEARGAAPSSAGHMIYRGRIHKGRVVRPDAAQAAIARKVEGACSGS
ncbi:MAG TPA: hypothetical protein PK694_07955, partial [Rhodospirillales bacterium]|nr:hypothetical protein [Rhodospirillales bacterium]